MKSITSALQTLTKDPTTTTLTSRSSAIATLVQPSRTQEEIRVQISDPPILKSITETLVTSLEDGLETADNALRCIANACIDNDTARDNICEHVGLQWVLACSNCQDDNIKLLTTKVLNNLCCEHENSQKACYQEQVHFALVTLLASDFARGVSIERKLAGELDAAIDVLFWISGHKASLEPNYAQDVVLPHGLLDKLFRLHDIWVEDWDIETFATLSETILVFIRDPTVQARIVHEKRLGQVRSILESQEVMIENLKLAMQPETAERRSSPPYCDTEAPAEEIKLLAPLSASLVWCISDIAAMVDFAVHYPLDDPEIKHAIATVQAAASTLDGPSSPQPVVYADGHAFNASCQVLGNLLWGIEPNSYAFLVLETELHNSLLDIIVKGRGMSDNLHSIGGLLVQLSRPSIAVRERIGSYERAPEAIERLVRHEKPQIKQGSIKLLKALGKDCPANQRRFAELAKVAMAALQPSDTTAAADSVVEVEE